MKHRITFYVFVVTALFLVAFSVPATEHPINLQTAQPSATNLPVITTVNVTHLKQVAQLGRGFIERLVWSPNNTSFAVCGSLGVWVYDIDNPQTPQLLESDTPCVSAVFNTNGTQLAFANEFNVYLWDVKTQTKRRLASDSQLFRPELAFEPSSPVLVIASRSGVIRRRNIETNLEDAPLNGVTSSNRFVISPDATMLAEVSEVDTTIRLLDSKTGGEVTSLKYNSGSVRNLVFSPDSTLLAVVYSDGKTLEWNVKTGEPYGGLEFTSEQTTNVAISPDKKLIATSALNGTIGIWRLRQGDMSTSSSGHLSNIHSMAFSPDGMMLISASNDGAIRLWNINTGIERPFATVFFTFVESVAFSPDGTQLAVGGGSGTWLWDIKTFTVRLMATAHDSQYVQSVAFSRDGAMLAWSDLDDTVRLWDLKTSTEQLTLHTNTRGGSENPAIVRFSPDESLLALGKGSGVLRVWNIKTRTLLDTQPSFDWDSNVGKWLQNIRMAVPQRFHGKALSPDGTLLATDENIVNLITGDKVSSLKSSNERILRMWSLAFNTDGTFLVSGGTDGTVSLWKVNTGEPLITLKGHTAPVTTVAFSPDGTIVASGSEDGTVRLWAVQPT